MINLPQWWRDRHGYRLDRHASAARAIESGSAYDAGRGKLDAAFDAANEHIERYNFPILRLRAIGFAATMAGVRGDMARCWKHEPWHWVCSCIGAATLTVICGYQFYADFRWTQSGVHRRDIQQSSGVKQPKTVETAPTMSIRRTRACRRRRWRRGDGDERWRKPARAYWRNRMDFANLTVISGAARGRVELPSPRWHVFDMQSADSESALGHLASRAAAGFRYTWVLLRYYRTPATREPDR